mgnify:CR=1 FL=1
MSEYVADTLDRRQFLGRRQVSGIGVVVLEPWQPRLYVGISIYRGWGRYLAGDGSPLRGRAQVDEYPPGTGLVVVSKRSIVGVQRSSLP